MQAKADGTDTSGLAELLGKCHRKPTSNASDSANYPAGTSVFSFTVLYVPVWVQEKQFLMHPGIQLIVNQTVKLHFTGTGPACTKTLSKEVVQGETKPRERSGSTATWGAECKITLFSYFFYHSLLLHKSQESSQVQWLKFFSLSPVH